MSKYIVAFAPNDVINDMLTTAHRVRDNFRSYSVNLTEAEKAGRSMAEGREGLARLISRIAHEHINVLSRSDDPNELENALQYDAALETIRQALLTLLEQVTETQMANSMDIMSMVDRYAGSFEAARRNSTALDLSLREVDEWNKRFGHRNPVKGPNPGETDPQ